LTAFVPFPSMKYFKSNCLRGAVSRDDGKRFVVRAEEKLTAFLELESAVRLDWDKDTKWVLFGPNALQRFARRKGGFMKKRRGKC